MDVISSNAPYYVTIATRDENGNQLGQYSIYAGSTDSSENLVYTGQIYSDEDVYPATQSVNLQPILVNYTPDEVGKLYNFGGSFTTATNNKISQEFVVDYYDTDGTDVSTNINMLYCTENATNHELGFDSSTSTFPMVANDFIQGKFFNGSYLSVTPLFAADSSNNTTFKINGIASGGAETTIWSSNPPMSTKRYCGQTTISSSYNKFYLLLGGTRVSKDIEVVNCLPANSYILYYVNPLGAIDYIICDKNNSVTYDTDRHSMTRYADISDRRKFGKINYLNNTTKTWTLNTDIMDDDASKQMYKVFYSEYMWLYDIDKDELNSVIMEDANLKIKKFQSEKIYNYTITVKSSQTFTIQ